MFLFTSNNLNMCLFPSPFQFVLSLKLNTHFICWQEGTTNVPVMFRYIQCRGGRPALSTCKNQLYFDYILLSCTLKTDARCIQD